jgi:hypothetical protein
MGAFLRDQWWVVAIFIATLVPLVRRFASAGVMEGLRTLDRRWIFLLMLWAVLLPIYFIGVTGRTFPEVPSALASAKLDEIDSLAPGDPVLLSFDYDPASEGELQPMATAFVKHCAEKKLKMYFMALWPVGPQMIQNTVDKVIREDYPHLVYGEDYVNLGYKSGYEAVIRSSRRISASAHDRRERHGIQDVPMMKGITSVQQMKLIINVSSGYRCQVGAVRGDAVCVDSPRRGDHWRPVAARLSVRAAAASWITRRHQGRRRIRSRH